MGAVKRSPPRGQRRRESARVLREETVLAAAERVFTENGYHGASMAKIAHEAEYAVGSLYKIFTSKEALFERLLEARLATLEQKVRDALASSASVHEQLEAVALTQARHAARDRAFMSLFVSSIPGAYQTLGLELPSARNHIARTHAALLEVIERGVKRREITRELPTRVILLAFTAATRAYNLEQVTKQRGEPDEVEVRALVRAFFKGFGARPA